MNIDVEFGLMYESTIVQNSATNRLEFKDLIVNNMKQTGFLLWLPNCSLSCIFQHNPKKLTYFLVGCKELQTVQRHIFEQFNDIHNLINMIYSFATTQNETSGEIECKVQFLSCSTQATKSEKQKALKKHKTTTQKEVHCKQNSRKLPKHGTCQKKTVVGN